jgi:hypothetical protein
MSKAPRLKAFASYFKISIKPSHSVYYEIDCNQEKAYLVNHMMENMKFKIDIF